MRESRDPGATDCGDNNALREVLRWVPGLVPLGLKKPSLHSPGTGASLARDTWGIRSSAWRREAGRAMSWCAKANPVARWPVTRQLSIDLFHERSIGLRCGLARPDRCQHADQDSCSYLVRRSAAVHQSDADRSWWQSAIRNGHCRSMHAVRNVCASPDGAPGISGPSSCSEHVGLRERLSMVRWQLRGGQGPGRYGRGDFLPSARPSSGPIPTCSNGTAEPKALSSRANGD